MHYLAYRSGIIDNLDTSYRSLAPMLFPNARFSLRLLIDTLSASLLNMPCGGPSAIYKRPGRRCLHRDWSQGRQNLSGSRPILINQTRQLAPDNPLATSDIYTGNRIPICNQPFIQDWFQTPCQSLIQTQGYNLKKMCQWVGKQVMQLGKEAASLTQVDR